MPLTINKRLQEGDFFEIAFGGTPMIFYVLCVDGNMITAGHRGWLASSSVSFDYDKTKGLAWSFMPWFRIYRPYKFLGNGRKVWWRSLVRFFGINDIVHPYSPPKTDN